MPFGGVGSSGQGAYRGRASFDVFTHRRSITTTPAWIEGMLDIRYPPYTPAKQKKFAGMNEMKPNFDRNGKEIGWIWSILGLGAGSKGKGVGRWLAVLLGESCAKSSGFSWWATAIY